MRDMAQVKGSIWSTSEGWWYHRVVVGLGGDLQVVRMLEHHGHPQAFCRHFRGRARCDGERCEESVCKSVCEREKEREREKVSVCVCERERGRKKECVCVCSKTTVIPRPSAVTFAAAHVVTVNAARRERVCESACERERYIYVEREREGRRERARV